MLVYRVVVIGFVAYVMQVDLEDEECIQDIQEFLISGDAVILVNELEDLEDYIDTEVIDIEIVEAD